jgi:hypothetical protein
MATATNQMCSISDAVSIVHVECAGSVLKPAIVNLETQMPCTSHSVLDVYPESDNMARNGFKTPSKAQWLRWKPLQNVRASAKVPWRTERFHRFSLYPPLVWRACP